MNLKSLNIIDFIFLYILLVSEYVKFIMLIDLKDEFKCCYYNVSLNLKYWIFLLKIVKNINNRKM